MSSWRTYRDIINPSIEEALELDEASRIKKFGAAMRAISLLLGPPHLAGHTAEPAAVVSPHSQDQAYVAKSEAPYKPPLRKQSQRKPTK